ncbi:MAG TPA: hypothetical protein VK458_06800, partial [Myxococcaceae bacterium]|nr:hypothetical protein [Myxococcaceae bacterium]
MEVRSSLARSTLMQMGVRIAVIIVLATVFSYLHIYNSSRTESLARLERSVVERGQREQALFVQAEDNQRVLQMALRERLQAWRQQEPNPRFDSLFVRLPDGTLRNRPDGFDGTRMPGLFVPKGVPDGVDLRRQLLAAYDVVAQYGPAFHVRFQNTYITLPGAYNVLFREDGQLIAHSDLKLEGLEEGYNILSDAGQPGASA